MVDIVVDTAAIFNQSSRTYSRQIVGINPNIHYAIYVDTAADLVFSKSSDGGLTWSAETSIHAGTVVKYNIWHDRWTPDDSGTLIHIILLDAEVALNSLSYYTLDTNDDTLSVEVEVDTPVVSSTVSYFVNQISIAKARGGNLLVQFWGNAIGSRGCFRSVDGGASWVARADAAIDNDSDYIMMFPGNEIDDQDMWLFYFDFSSKDVLLKTYDDSANSWSDTLIVTPVFENNFIWQFAGAIRHSDGHLLLAIWTEMDDPTADILTFDINGAASIIARTNVITNQSESGCACISINQQNDDVYVGYLKGGVWNATVDSVYKKSTDGMSTWEAEQAMSENAADDYRSMSSTLSIGDNGGKFLPMWFNTDLDDLLVNVNNAVTIEPIVPPVEPGLPEYGQPRAAIGDPSVYGATIVRS